MYVYIYIYIYIYNIYISYIHTYIHTYTHTYIHTYILIGGHPGDQPAHVVRQEADIRGPPVLLPLSAPLGVRGHVCHLQGVL